MDFDLQWILLGLPVAFAFGWLASRIDVRQWKRERDSAPRKYFEGLNLLLNEQHDKAIDAFIEAVQEDPDTTELHFALGNLFRRRGEYERAVRVHQHLLARGDLRQVDRDRAQNALALDFMKAGLFDRAEASWRALQGSAFDSESRMALLTLHERSRDWRAAVDTALQLEASGIGSYATRVAHYGCELAIEADARGEPDAADAAIAQAREAAPLAVRPLLIEGQRAMRRGDAEQALRSWGTVLAAQPAHFSLVAREHAECARQCGQGEAALAQLKSLYEREPTLDLLDAMAVLDPDADRCRERLRAHLGVRPSVAAARALLQCRAGTGAPGGAGAASDAELEAVQQALADAARPLQRYRCAACGFEAQQYFWQCPGCLSWDTYPPRRIGDQ